MTPTPPKICLAITSPLSARFLQGQVRYLAERGWEVAVISSDGPGLQGLCEREGAKALPVPFAREIAPLADVIALAQLWRSLRAFRPVVVNAGTPKAGLLTTYAAWAAGVPVRIYTVRGLRYEGAQGLRKLLLEACELVACLGSTRVVCVSHSVLEELVSRRLCTRSKARVIGAGSSNGVPAQEIAARLSNTNSKALRRELGIPPGAPVLGFVGRFSRDKGLDDLLEAFASLAPRFPDARLLLVGDRDPTAPLPEKVAATLDTHSRILRTGFVEDPFPYYALMDMLVLPSRREGFPNVVLEAASAALPTIAYRATGSVDAVVDGVTGCLVDQGDREGLAEAIKGYLNDDPRRMAHGLAARERAFRDFQPETIWAGLLREYRQSSPRPGLRSALRTWLRRRPRDVSF